MLYGDKVKEYKSNEQLVEYLIQKNVIINDKEKVIKMIDRYTYYSIINGYKDVFKDGKKYKANVSFEEIFALYEFDKNIKAIFLKFTLEIELIIKAKMANMLAEKYGVRDYIKEEYFEPNIDKELVSNLIKKINEEIEKNYEKHLAIKHYKDQYGFVPPFVLFKILTFGVVSRYYGILQQKDRQTVSKYFKLSDKVLKQMLINFTMVRNIAAHSDRLFCYRSKYYINFEKNCKRNEKMITSLYTIIRCMERLLKEEQYKEFKRLFGKEIKRLETKLTSIAIKDVLKIMGFHT